MKAHLWRWAKRLLGVFSLLVLGIEALYQIAATLFSNMDRLSAACVCLTTLAALVVCERLVWRTYFGAASPAVALDEEVADADPEPEPDVIVRAPMSDEAAVINSDALASLTGAKKEQVWL